MKYIYITICCAASLVAAWAIAHSNHNADEYAASISKLRGELKSIGSQITDYKEIVVQHEKAIASLESELVKSKGELAQSKIKLDYAMQNIAGYEAELNTKENYSRLVSPPTITTNGNDRITFFSTIVGIKGGRLATNGTFGGLYGRRLVFRFASSTPRSFDVDDLHPMMLKYLGIDAEAAKLQQVQLEQARTERERADYVQSAKDQQALAIQRIAAAKIYAEQVKADEESRLKKEAAENERLKAIAAAKAADAAMIQAQKPPDQTIMIQQNEQIQQVQQPQPHPNGYYLRDGVWVPY